MLSDCCDAIALAEESDSGVREEEVGGVNGGGGRDEGAGVRGGWWTAK